MSKPTNTKPATGPVRSRSKVPAVYTSAERTQPKLGTAVLQNSMELLERSEGIPASFLGSAEVSAGFTRSLGNYEFLKTQVSVTFPVDVRQGVEGFAKAMDEATEIIDERLGQLDDHFLPGTNGR